MAFVLFQANDVSFLETSHTLSKSSLIINHCVIRCYVLWATDSIIKLKNMFRTRAHCYTTKCVAHARYTAESKAHFYKNLLA
jgi:hypothetical protein